MSGLSKEQQALKIKKQIEDNNILLLKLTNQNIRLFNSLNKLDIFCLVSPENKIRYDLELSTDNWKKYSKNHFAIVYDESQVYCHYLDTEEECQTIIDKLLNEECTLSNLRILSMYELSKIK